MIFSDKISKISRWSSPFLIQKMKEILLEENRLKQK